MFFAQVDSAELQEVKATFDCEIKKLQARMAEVEKSLTAKVLFALSCIITHLKLIVVL